MKTTLSSLACLVLITACQKAELAVPANQRLGSILPKAKNTLTITTSASDVSTTSEWLKGTIEFTGDESNIMERGFCYSTSPSPTVANDTVRVGSGVGYFAKVVEGLTISTTYYTRAFAYKKNGNVFYGNEVSFTTLSNGMPSPGIGTVTDIDGNVYTTLTYGTQVWMVENLKTTHFRNGGNIPNVKGKTNWSTKTGPAYCNYNNDSTIGDEYGRLYNLYAMQDSRGIAPEGWHVPSMTEWKTLISFLGGENAGGRMKEAGYTHWLAPNTGADNSSGFTMLGAGSRSINGDYYGLQNHVNMWSSNSRYTAGNDVATMFYYFWRQIDADIHYSYFGMAGGEHSGFPIRCVKD